MHHHVSQKQMGLNEAGSLPVTEDKTFPRVADEWHESRIKSRVDLHKITVGCIEYSRVEQLGSS